MTKPGHERFADNKGEAGNQQKEQPKRKRELSDEGLSAANLNIPDVYKEIFYDNYRYFLLSSGRISGKTSILVSI